jgi:long-chain fatty acid transport protein
MHKKMLMRALPAAILGLTAGSSFAAGFALIEQSASGLGNSFAGAAAVAEDASTIFFNPAGMTKLPEGKQVVVALHAIDPSAKFSNGASASAAGSSGTAPALFSFQGFGGDAGSTAFVPNAYFSMALSPNLRLGLGLNAPFGMKTEYDDDWIGRFQALKSEVKTINLNPSIAFKANDRISLGFGLDYQRMDATLTKAVNYTAIVLGTPVGLGGGAGTAIPMGSVEGRNEIKGDDTAWGFNFGVIFDVSESTRLGLAYRSEIKYHLTGTHTATHPTTAVNAANLIIAGNPATQNQNVSLDIKMPDTLSASVVQHLNDRWDMLGDLSWTGWSKIQELRIKYTVAGAADEVTTWKLRDTYRVSFGGTYRYSDATKFRFGLAYDQSPVTDQYRTARLPDNNRTWVSVGAQYALSKGSSFDWGYAHLFVKDSPINTDGEKTSIPGFGYPRGLLNGTYKDSIDILSVQYTASF